MKKGNHDGSDHVAERQPLPCKGRDLTNFGHHRTDPFTYDYAKDDTGPVEIEPYGQWPQHPDAVGPWGWVELKYAGGVRFVIEAGKWGKPYDRPAGEADRRMR